MDCKQVSEFLAEYALDLLSPDDREAVDDHLQGCPDCRAQLRQYLEIAAGFPEALTAVSPARLPTRVKDRLLARLEQSDREQPVDSQTAMTPADDPETPVLRPAGKKDDDGARGQQGAPPPQTVRGVDVLQQQDGSEYSRRVRRLGWTLALTASLLVIFVVWTIHLSAVLARERALHASYRELMEQQEVVLEVIDSSWTTRRLLLPPARDSRAYGKVFTREDMPYVVAMAARLLEPPPGTAYHLWLIRGEEVEFVGLMNINHEGFAMIFHEAGSDRHDYDYAQVTLQPVDSSGPSGEPILDWKPDPSG